ncbi:hypothetical protein EVAR_74271_1 [Eumeta japonica]|uniref:Uncharacterized protein n=1 Tax=Eumeta variegata TaxID=151549 RepID=A0A4C1SCJ4_EUMVA|nr:hypothetical protein EVAR_74271_1 [Eumeta japonica]
MVQSRVAMEIESTTGRNHHHGQVGGRRLFFPFDICKSEGPRGTGPVEGRAALGPPAAGPRLISIISCRRGPSVCVKLGQKRASPAPAPAGRSGAARQRKTVTFCVKRLEYIKVNGSPSPPKQSHRQPTTYLVSNYFGPTVVALYLERALTSKKKRHKNIFVSNLYRYLDINPLSGGITLNTNAARTYPSLTRNPTHSNRPPRHVVGPSVSNNSQHQTTSNYSVSSKSHVAAKPAEKLITSFKNIPPF